MADTPPTLVGTASEFKAGTIRWFELAKRIRTIFNAGKSRGRL